MEDKAKIQAKIAELNRLFPPAAWSHVDGFHGITNFTFAPGADLTGTFGNNYGYPVKIFVNNTTGEVKLFAAVMFRL